MRLLIVTHYFADHQGGIEIVAGQLAGRLSRSGILVTWAASAPVPQHAPKDVERIAMRAWNACERRLGMPYPLWSLSSLRTLWRAVRDCDVVHLHEAFYFGNLFAYLAAKWMRKPLVVTQHVGHIPFRNPLLRALLWLAHHTLSRFVLARADRVIFVSETVYQYFLRFVNLGDRALLIPNGVDTSVFYPATPRRRRQQRELLGWRGNSLYFLFVGRFVEKKGLHLLRQLAERFPQCTWVFIGWGPLDPSTWGLDNVVCLGRLPQNTLPDYYRAADLLILPSVGEGFPLVVQEAMACGTTACLTTEVAESLLGVREHVFATDQNVDEWSEMVARIIDNAVDLEAARAQTSKFASEHWDWERCSAQYHNVLLEALSPAHVIELPLVQGKSG